MRSFIKPLFGFALLFVAVAGCGNTQDVIACGACNSFASKHGVVATCCNRGCAIPDPDCPTMLRYVAGDGNSFAECVDECTPDASATIDMSHQD